MKTENPSPLPLSQRERGEAPSPSALPQRGRGLNPSPGGRGVGARAIFINGRFLTQPLTGVQRYCRELLRAMDALNPDVELVCLAPPEEFQRPDWKNIRLEIVGKNRGNLWEQIDLPLALRGGFLFSPANLGPFFYTNQAVTMHDASTYAVPEAYSLGFRLKYRLGFGLLARLAKMIFTDSQFSRRELARFTGVGESRFHVILLGGDHFIEAEPDDSVLDEFGLREKPFLLMVANQSPHKNTARLIEAASQIRVENIHFALGGRSQAIFQQESLGRLPDHILPLGYVSDAALLALYRHAIGFIFPSRYEGFGLPVLEAMNCGCPVLCSRAASLLEVGGDAALYFDPLDVDDMAAKIGQFLGDPALSARLKARGLAQARRFTWQQAASQTLELLLG